MVKQKSNLIGVIYEVTSGFSNLFFSAVLESFRLEAENLGYQLILLSQTDINKKSYAMTCLSHKIDACFIISTNDQSLVESDLNAHQIKVLTLDPVGPSKHLIMTNNEQAMSLSLNYLHSKGHRSIGFIHGSLSATIGLTRLNTYLHFMKKNNLDPLYIKDRDNQFYTVQEGYETTLALLKAHPNVTALACASDVLALGAIYAITDQNLNVPKDISVMGFDDLRLSEIIRPKLSTIRQDTKSLGIIACRTLLKMSNEAHTKILIDASLVIRDSTT